MKSLPIESPVLMTTEEVSHTQSGVVVWLYCKCHIRVVTRVFPRPSGMMSLILTLQNC